MNSILVTGGNGFVGSHVVEALKSKLSSKYVILSPNSKKLDCTDLNQLKDFILFNHCSHIVHLAALCGGIGANSERPADFFIQNLKMSANILDASFSCGIKKLVTVGTVCSYPSNTSTPFKEDTIWDGYPERTNAPYGLAKKMLMVGCEAYHQQYNSNFIHLIPCNMYGPRDNFDLKTSHVIPALIRKFYEAKKNNLGFVEIWGDGKVSREFLYVEDFAEALCMAFEKCNTPYPINVGTGNEIRIKDLVKKIQEKVGYSGNIIYNDSKPSGQEHRHLDVTLAKESFGFEAKTDLDRGLDKTIKWYLNNL